MTTPSLADLMRRSASSLLDGQYVTLPAVVERYDADRQCVDAQPTITREVVGEDGAAAVERLPVVTNAPVVFPGSGPYRITWPVEVGSTVVLHFTSVAMDRWLAIGGRDVEPRDSRRHDLSSAFAMPGGHSFGGSTAPPTSAPTDAMVLHGGAFRLGADATARVARQPDLEILGNAIQASPDGVGFGTSLKAALSTSGWPNCASIVKAE